MSAINSLNDVQHGMEELKKNVDMMFLIIMGCLVFLLKAGFAFFECSFVRVKNVTSVLFRNFLDSTISTLAYLIFGYGLAFGEAENGFCGTQYFGLVGLPDDKLAHCFFHYSFASCAGTIISGVVHERCTMTAYFWYTFLISGFVYPITVHWVATKNGWLKILEFDDFAYGAVVHALGGAGALAATLMVGPRVGRFDVDGTPKRIFLHSIPEAVTGLFIFFIGMIAFNFGSQESISELGDGLAIATVVMNVMVCVIASTFTALFYHRFIGHPYEWDMENGLNGSLIGMVVVCAGCNQYPFWGSALLGISGYLVFIGTRYIVRDKLQIDDVLDGVSLHIAGGYWGTLGVCIFKQGGLITDPSKITAYRLMINTIGGLAIMLWSFTIIFLLYCVLRCFNLHRASELEEKIGLDLTVHMQPAYGDLHRNLNSGIDDDEDIKSPITINPITATSLNANPDVIAIKADDSTSITSSAVRRIAEDDVHDALIHRVPSSLNHHRDEDIIGSVRDSGVGNQEEASNHDDK